MDLPYNDDIDLANLFLHHRGLALLDCDDDGVPAFEDYFNLVYDRAPVAMLAALEANSDGTEDPGTADHADRCAIAMGYLVVGLADKFVELYQDPETMLDNFIRMLRNAVAQCQVEQEED